MTAQPDLCDKQNDMNANAGMTTRVVRGSLWSLGGQAATLAASFIATPFVIRSLGNEAYGVLMLINLLIGYVAFADLGMGQAATRFASEAHARGDEQDEQAVLWTSLLVLSATMLAAALALFLSAGPLVRNVLRLPESLHDQAILALRIACVGLFARAVVGVFSSPQLARMRLGLYTLVNTLGGVGQVALVPIVLLMGGDLVSAIAVMAGVNIAVAFIHAAVSSRLSSGLLKPRFNFKLTGHLVRFGIATSLMTLVGLALFNAERFFVVRFASVTALAYYSVAFTLARLLALLPAAMGQPLLPAFTRLQAAPERQPLQMLYTRALRGLLLWTAPLALIICIAARPFLALWAGPEYARESALPLYILAAGCVFDGLSYVPRILLSAVGKPERILRYQMLNLLPYLLLAAILIPPLGATGAALAWSLRATIECLLMFRAVRSAVGLSPMILTNSGYSYWLALVILAIPFLLFSWLWPSLLMATISSLISVAAYAALTWFLVLTTEERNWIGSMMRSARGYIIQQEAA